MLSLRFGAERSKLRRITLRPFAYTPDHAPSPTHTDQLDLRRLPPVLFLRAELPRDLDGDLPAFDLPLADFRLAGFLAVARLEPDFLVLAFLVPGFLVPAFFVPVFLLLAFFFDVTLDDLRLLPP